MSIIRFNALVYKYQTRCKITHIFRDFSLNCDILYAYALLSGNKNDGKQNYSASHHFIWCSIRVI